MKNNSVIYHLRDDANDYGYFKDVNSLFNYIFDEGIIDMWIEDDTDFRDDIKKRIKNCLEFNFADENMIELFAKELKEYLIYIDIEEVK